jgi:hypothetical protein
VSDLARCLGLGRIRRHLIAVPIPGPALHEQLPPGGTKIHANASRHSALSYAHAGTIEARLRAEVAALMAKAEAVDQATCRTAYRSPRSWRGASSAWPRSPGPG